jgi:iron complex outermembrane recepter protein
MPVSKLHVKHAVMLALGTTLVLITAQPIVAAEPVNLGTVQTSGKGEDQPSSQSVESAPYQAPTKTPLSATQPTSVISQQYIENNIPPSANYDDIVKIAPSVFSVSPNGPGLAENQILSIRGFSDGFYNVTFDGIPWGDSNDFTHHSTSYFMDRDLGAISVDRGPGTAATIGNATFGGTISVNSKAPSAATTLTPYASYGSFNTQVYGTQIDTGAVEKYEGASAFLDVEGLTSDGYLSNLGLTRENAFLKAQRPFGTHTVVTVVAMYNQLKQYISLGSTQAQINANGPSYGLNRDPTSQAYYGYNYDKIHNDFEYVGIKSAWDGGWSLDNKTYTYAYFHDGFNGEDPNGETPNKTSYGNDVPGQVLVNYYRSYGDTLKLTRDMPFGDIQAGAWVDYQINTRRLTEVDFTLGGAINPLGNPGSAIPGVDRALDQSLTTLQPFVQIDWKALPGLTLSPGLRYDYFDRRVNSQVNVNTGVPQRYSTSFHAVLPSLLAHYELSENWAAYAQAAKGFLAPNENFFNRSAPGSTSLQPQQSWNYQLGTSWQSQRLAVSADAYYIDFNNLIGSKTVSGVGVIYFNQGGVTYKGIEAEATGYLGAGFSAYVNGSVNSAKDKQSGLSIANAPTATAAGGVIYNLNGWYASLLDKWVGDRYGDVGDAQPLSSYSTLDGALGYTCNNGLWGSSKPSIKLAFNNLLNSTKIYALAGYTAFAGTPLYWTIPGRSIFATVTVPF